MPQAGCSHVESWLNAEERQGAIWCGRMATLGVPHHTGKVVNLCAEHAAVYVSTLAHRIAQAGPDYRAAVSEVMRETLSDPLFGAPPERPDIPRLSLV